LLKNVGLEEINQVRLSGGGANSPLWRQILADVMNVELVTVETTEGASYGAALLAGVGAGIWPSVSSACKKTIHLKAQTPPHPENVERYAPFYQIYQSLYPNLKESFKSLSLISSKGDL
jgi:xylulokinase